MRARGSSGVRRSGAEWAKLVAAWTRSGLSAAAFARSRGVSPRTLTWWRWRLAAPPGEAPAFVEVALAPADVPAAPAWEVVVAGGHVVRVYTDAAPTSLRVVLEALAATAAAR